MAFKIEEPLCRVTASGPGYVSSSSPSALTRTGKLLSEQILYRDTFGPLHLDRHRNRGGLLFFLSLLFPINSTGDDLKFICNLTSSLTRTGRQRVRVPTKKKHSRRSIREIYSIDKGRSERDAINREKCQSLRTFSRKSDWPSRMSLHRRRVSISSVLMNRGEYSRGDDLALPWQYENGPLWRSSFPFTFRAGVSFASLIHVINIFPFRRDRTASASIGIDARSGCRIESKIKLKINYSVSIAISSLEKIVWLLSGILATLFLVQLFLTWSVSATKGAC